MIAAEDIALVVLAAGRSKRFGDADKLEQMFLGKPLAFHIVNALETMPFGRRIAVVSDTRLDFAAFGYEVIANLRAEDGQSRSLALGVEAARRGGARAVLVVLADMPRVSAAQVERLLAAAVCDDAVVASSDGVRPMPPALFGRDHFTALVGLEGDRGARNLIRAGKHVVANPEELIDIDTPEQLEALRAFY